MREIDKKIERLKQKNNPLFMDCFGRHDYINYYYAFIFRVMMVVIIETTTGTATEWKRKCFISSPFVGIWMNSFIGEHYLIFLQ